MYGCDRLLCHESLENTIVLLCVWSINKPTENVYIFCDAESIKHSLISVYFFNCRIFLITKLRYVVLDNIFIDNFKRYVVSAAQIMTLKIEL